MSAPRARLATLALLLAPALMPASGEAQPATTRELEVEGVRLHVALDETEFSTGAPVLLEWIERSLHIVAHYYGAFPVRELTIRVLPGPMGGVGGGTTFGAPRALIRVRVGRGADAATLRNDWVLVHEMTHLALPEVGEEHAWLSEGLATYVEGVARVQAGNRTAADVWAEDLRSMPRGLPQPGDRGLDHTHTWGRTYWGGALFCLLADIEIRQRTANRQGLQQALRAIARESGGLGTQWPIDRVFATGDRAVGTRVLEELYASMKDAPVATDLPALWRRLGIEADGDTVRVHEDAPLAPIRWAILGEPPKEALSPRAP
jgi:hypothetical protein